MREDPDELPDEIMDDLLDLIDGPEGEYWPGVERLCAIHPKRQTRIRCEADVLWAAIDPQRAEPSAGELDDLPDAIEDEVCAAFFAETVIEDPEAALSDLCARYPAFVSTIRRLAARLAAQIADLRRRLGDVWRLSHAAGRYEVIEQLGSGSFGTVSVVRDRLLGRRVALKTIRPKHGTRLHQIAPWMVHRFLDEAQIAAQLRHPGIPLVHDLGIGEFGVPYYTMRYVRGQTLGRVFEGLGGDLRGAVRLLVPVAEALAYAHSKSVLHRDLKPDNIVVGRFGEVCVVDWGLARASRADPSDDRESHIRTDRGVNLNSGGMGSEGYMAPEQRRGEFHEASDVYSLTAILHLCLVGRPPLVSDRYAPVTLPRRAWRRDRWLAEICIRGLAPRVEDRYAQMDDLLADLRAYLDGLLPMACTPRLWDRLRVGWGRLCWSIAGLRPRRDPAGAHEDSVRKGVARPGPSSDGHADHTAITQAAFGGSRRASHLGQRLDLIRGLSTPVGRYREGNRLGEGGMGVVTAMGDALLRRSVAVKTLKAGLDDLPEIRARFLDEAQIAAQLDHPAILTVHEIGVDPGGAIRMVMPIVSGGHLGSAPAAGVSWQAPVQRLLRAAWGLAFAHEKGVVHRDVKPMNILLGQHEDAYLADWGLAVLVGVPGAVESKVRVHRGASLDDFVDETLTDESDLLDPFSTVFMRVGTGGVVAGTPAYMAPECALGDLARIRPHSDVWSLGVVLFELLTGTHPYFSEELLRSRGGLGLQELMHRGPSIPSARALNRSVPKSLAALCARALQHDPMERFPNAEEFARALEAALAS